MMCPAGGSGEAASPGAVLPVQERGPSSSWIKVLAWLQFLLGVTQEWESGSYLPNSSRLGADGTGSHHWDNSLPATVSAPSVSTSVVSLYP